MYTSTDLTRNTKKVLDAALRQPVTITRGTDTFVLRQVDADTTIKQLVARVTVLEQAIHTQ